MNNIIAFNVSTPNNVVKQVAAIINSKIDFRNLS